MKKLTLFKSMVVSGLLFFQSCNYLDVVPDNAPTIDNAFTCVAKRSNIWQPCYSYLPNDGERL